MVTVLRRLSIVLAVSLAAGFGGCAAPRTQVGSLTRQQLLAEQAKQQELAARSLAAQQERVSRVAYPLLRAAAPLCGADVRTASGAGAVTDTLCAYSVVVARSDVLNAWADGRTVAVTTAMLRFVADDDELAVVLAHEIAHDAMHHVDARRKNAFAGALLGAAADVAVAAAGRGNTGGEFARQGAQAGAMVFSQDFEREADYIGLYLLAWAGRTIDNAPTFWRRMAIENPGQIKFAGTHPTTAERFVRLEQWRSEIALKAALGEPVGPKMRGGRVTVARRVAPSAPPGAPTTAVAGGPARPAERGEATVPLQALEASVARRGTEAGPGASAGAAREFTAAATGARVAVTADSPQRIVRADPGVVIDGRVATMIYITMRTPGSYGQPVPSVPLVVTDALGGRRELATNDAGALNTLLPPGNYQLRTARPVEWQGLLYNWNVVVTVQPGAPIIELSQDNATSVTPAPPGAGRRNTP